MNTEGQVKGIVLLSGGLDSTLTLTTSLLDPEACEVVPFFVDYNQWPVNKEREAVEKICSKIKDTYNYCFEGGYKLQDLVVYKVMEEEKAKEKIGSVWGRSIALVGLASMWAYTHGDDFSWIATGVHEGDVGPDCKPGEFDEIMNHALGIATKFQIALTTPIARLDINQIGIALRHHGIHFDWTYSCYWDPPCGYKSDNELYRCPGCRRKTLAMRAADIDSNKFLDFPNGNKKDRSYQSLSALSVEY